MMMLQALERPKPRASRIKGCRYLLQRIVTLRAEYQRLRAQVERAALGRLQSDVEMQWLGQAADHADVTLERQDRLITAGDAVLPGQSDPTPQRKARKRKALDGYPSETQWERDTFGP